MTYSGNDRADATELAQVHRTAQVKQPSQLGLIRLGVALELFQATDGIQRELGAIGSSPRARRATTRARRTHSGRANPDQTLRRAQLGESEAVPLSLTSLCPSTMRTGLIEPGGPLKELRQATTSSKRGPR